MAYNYFEAEIQPRRASGFSGLETKMSTFESEKDLKKLRAESRSTGYSVKELRKLRAEEKKDARLDREAYMESSAEDQDAHDNL